LHINPGTNIIDTAGIIVGKYVLFLYTDDEKIMSQNHNMAAIANVMMDMRNPLENEFLSFVSRKYSIVFIPQAMSTKHHINTKKNMTVNC